MIRYTNSMLLSLLFHSLLLIAVFYSFTNVPSPKLEEQKICMQLCVMQKEQKQKVQQTQEVPSPIKNEPQKKMPEEKKELLEKVEKVPTKKNIEHKKEHTVETPPKVEAEPNKSVEVAQTQESQKIVNTAVRAEAEVSPPEVKEDEEYLEEHLAVIKRLLEENLYYPRSARKRGITGEVIVKFKLSQDATIAYIRVLNSPNEILSRGAVQTIENIATKFPKPKKDLILEVPINYKLSD